MSAFWQKLLRLKPARGGRIVTIMERAGYSFLALLVGFSIYGYFKRVPVQAGAVGTATPTIAQFKAEADTFVLSAHASHAQQVEQGRQVLQVTDDPSHVALFRAREILNPADRETAAREPGEDYAAPVRALLSTLLAEITGKPLLADRDAWLIFPDGNAPSGYQPKDTLLFSLADFDSLTVTVSIAKANRADDLEIGQPARVWCDELDDDPLPAKLVSLAPGGSDIPEGQIATVQASLEYLPAKKRELARTDYFAGKMEEEWQPMAQVTVAEERLIHFIRKPKE